MTIGITIAHAAHRPERVATLHRMLDQLPDWPTHIESAPGKPHEWSERQWRGGLALGTDHVLCLNDDMVLCEGFGAVLEAVVAARPNHLVHLYNAHSLARQAQVRQLRWLTTCDGLFGNAYLLPAAGLAAFLEWRASAPVPEFIEHCSEDNLLNIWAMSQGALIWHTVPALADHDASIPSCYGNDANHGRTATVGPWKKMPRSAEAWDTDAIHLGRYYAGSHRYLVTRMREPMIDRYFELCSEIAL